MRLVSFDDDRPGILRDGRVVDVSSLIGGYSDLQADQRMPALIAGFARLRPALDGMSGVPLADVRLRPPLPRPRKLLCELGDYNETIPEPKGATDFYLKSPESIAGPGAAIVLPAAGGEPFMARGAVATVIGSTCRNVAAGHAMNHVFGYTAFVDIGTEAFGRPKIGTFFGNSFDGFGPLGPWIVTRDELADPASIRVRLAVNGQAVQEYGFTDLHFSLPEQIEAASAIMTLRPGDVLVSGQFRRDSAGLRPGDAVQLVVDGIGELSVTVAHP